MAKVILSGYIIVPTHDLKAVQIELTKHIQLTRQEMGCLVFTVEQSPDDPARFNVYEEFTCQQAFELHQQRVKNSTWGDVTKNVTRHYQLTTG